MGSCFQAFPVTGSFSRSSVKAQIGARTQAAGLVVATVMCIVLTSLTQVLYWIPNNVISAIIISALLGLLDPEAIWRIYKTDKRDFAMYVANVLAVIFLGVELGMAFAVGLSLLVLVFNNFMPHTAVLGRIPGTPIYRSIAQYPDAKKNTHPGVMVVRIDGGPFLLIILSLFISMLTFSSSLFGFLIRRIFFVSSLHRSAPLWFANAPVINGIIASRIERQEKEEGEMVKWVIWDMSPIFYVDSTGTQEMQYILKDFQMQGRQLVLANPHGSVLRTFERAGVVGRGWGLSYDDPAKGGPGEGGWGELHLTSGAVGRQWIFASTSEAVQTVLKAKADGYEPVVQEHTFKDIFGNVRLILFYSSLVSLSGLVWCARF